MGGVVWFEDDETGENVQVSQSRPFPVTGIGGSSTTGASLRADDPLTYDPDTSTVGARTNVAGGVPTLDSAGKLNSSQMPPLQPDVGEASSEAEMLALDVTAPAIAVRSDFDPPHVFMLTDDPATDVDNWSDTGGFSNAGAGPTAQVGLNPQDGSAATYMRSDAAPALDQSIAPTWSGEHTFTEPVTHQAEVVYEAPVALGDNNITGLADGVDPQDAVSVAQLDAATSEDPGPAAYNAPVPAVLAYKTQDQGIALGGPRTLTWQATVYDPHGMLTNSTDLVVPEWATHARLTVQVMYQSSGSETERRLVGAQINGDYRPGISWDLRHMSTGDVDAVFRYVSAIVPVSSGDVITALTRQYSTEGKTVRAGASSSTWVQIELCPA